jgi:hypothetical protein
MVEKWQLHVNANNKATSQNSLDPNNQNTPKGSINPSIIRYVVLNLGFTHIFPKNCIDPNYIIRYVVVNWDVSGGSALAILSHGQEVSFHLICSLFYALQLAIL